MSFEGLEFHEFESREELMRALGLRVADSLREALMKKGKASLSVPGGTTPAPFLRALAREELDWSHVTVFPNDERLVDEHSDRSNLKLVRENLMPEKAAGAALLSFLPKPQNDGAALEEVIKGLTPHLPIDVLIVGMGEDMHTASLFPDSPDLDAALAPDAPPLVQITSKSAGEKRISLGGSQLREAKNRFVLIAGANKLAALKNALKAKSERAAPIRLLLTGDKPAAIYYAE